MGLIFLAAAVCFSVSLAQAKYSGGTGEPNDPFRIATAEDMNDIGNHHNDWDKHFLLVNDINLADYTGTQFSIIGNDSNAFSGVFDGNEHTISNFSYTTTGTSYIGIFGYVRDTNAAIKDLGIIDPNIDTGTGDYVGSLIGLLQTGKISRCFSRGGSVTGNMRVGGLIGAAGGMTTTISNCYSVTRAAGQYEVGGLIGTAGVLRNNVSVLNCYSAGTVTVNFRTF